MEKITELLDNLENLGDKLPKLDTLAGWVEWLISLAVRVGPVCILVLGLIHLLIPPKEANWKAGYRTYFGMGSITAWHFTQRVSGILMTVVGLILTIIAYISVAKFHGMDLMQMAYEAFTLVKVQAIFAALIYVSMFVLTAVMFTRNGDCRYPAFMDTPMGQLLFVDESAPVKFDFKKLFAKDPESEYQVDEEPEYVETKEITIEDP